LIDQGANSLGKRSIDNHAFCYWVNLGNFQIVYCVAAIMGFFKKAKEKTEEGLDKGAEMGKAGYEKGKELGERGYEETKEAAEKGYDKTKEKLE
jgi:hypothetical protein